MTTRSPHPSSTLLLNALDIALLLSILLMVAAWFFDPVQVEWGPVGFSASWSFKTILPPFLLVAARAAWARRLRRNFPALAGLADRPFYKKCCMALLSPFVALLILEGVAALMGVQPAPSAPIVITGEEAEDTHVENNRIVKDPELLFAFQPGITWGGFPINSHGFRTREFPAAKPAGTMRLMAMGDSCTAQGMPPYSDRLHELLQANPPTAQPWEAFNTGVFGYSVMQGYRQFLKHGRHFGADVVTIYFGWNDHWTFDQPDHLRMAVRMNPIAAATMGALREKKFFALLGRLANRSTPNPSDVDGKVHRVPEDLYAKTLADLIGSIRESGALPIVITAPRRELNESLVRAGHARSTDEAEAAHDRYVELSRQVARETGAELLDLAALFADPEYDRFFSKDGIHFTERGLQRIAETLHAKLLELAASERLSARKS